MSSERMTVAVTGAAGYLGRRLIRSLCAEGRVERVLGFDTQPPRFRSEKFVFDTLDVRDERLGSRLAGADVLVHLAFVMNAVSRRSGRARPASRRSGRARPASADEASMRDINVNGTQNVFHCAADAGVAKLVYPSSATVYGAHPDNQVPLTEKSPLRANLDFSYAAHKLEVEYIAREFRAEHPEVVLTLFRPALVCGAGVDNAWSRLIEAPVRFAIKDHSPPFQFVHADDVVAALGLATFNDLDGVFNLTPRGWLEHDEAAGLLGHRPKELSAPVAFSLMGRLWDRGLAEAPAGMLHYLMYPWVMSGAKLTEAGFVCEHSNAETLQEALSHLLPYVRIGRARVPRATLRRSATVAAAGAVAAAALRAARRVRSSS
ncbi:MAG: NAD-dependent epimerase/dehydratase family protein [Actinomycetota bacterium]